MKTTLPTLISVRRGTLLLFCALCLFAAPASANPLVEKLKDYPGSIRGENINVALLFRGIARQAGITIYVTENIDEVITLEMEDRTLYDIFQLIIEAKNLRYFEKNGLLFIQRADEYESRGSNLLSERLCPQYGNAGDLQPQLTTLLSEAGSIMITDRGNCLLVKDRSEQLESIKEMITELDRPIPQVHIESRIVIVTQEAKRRLGIKWGFANQYNPNSGTLDVTGAIDHSVANSSTFAFGFIRNNLNLNAELQALEQDNLARILSSPRILVLDGKEAEIKQGKEVAFVTQTADSINTSFREANLGLKVTPKIIKGRYIILDLNVTNDSIATLNTGGQPTIDTQEISSSLFLEDGVTVVIGGILLENKTNTGQHVPGLSSIPLLGKLFDADEKENSRYELNVFITPTIVNLENAAFYRKATAQGVENFAVPAAPAQQAEIIVEEQPGISPKENPENNLPETAPLPALKAVKSEPVYLAPEKNKLAVNAEEKIPTYIVQVGAFLDREKAEELRQELQKKGYTTEIIIIGNESDRQWHILSLGEYVGWSKASKAAAEFKETTSTTAVVLPKSSL